MKITMEQLAEKMDVKIWQKGDIKRIYLNDVGYNTKKMTTKTFIYEKDGEFMVSCYIDCPTQAVQWIKSQEEETKNYVYGLIEKTIFEIENPGVDFEEHREAMEKKADLEKSQKMFLDGIESLRVSWANDYEASKNKEESRQKALEIFRNMTEEQKAAKAALEAERDSITGTPGSAKKRKELNMEINKFPGEPGPLFDWMAEALKFASPEEYVAFKESTRRQELKLA